MSTFEIRTDRKFKPFAYRSEVPAKVLASQFDHLSEDDAFDGFFKYRGYWYHLSDFMAPAGLGADELAQWDGYHSDSAFSGVLVKVSRDGESYMAGTYLA